ncbi:hypothetical protein AVEN_198829-1 [Araneus ventricosus]|uniref:Uncharacterized protein n=1 Tax=Araneus ventricosus TaxID=182803 RepID=A0A4Y2VJZ2_ARAVE|nr:hypothetical protein AVEN_101976-1 [Araneus ventricosus]GBO25609.1 hypothetical protein AVEN_198829-1 [Araneus ventricosus]
MRTEFSLVTLASPLKATRGLLWNWPPNFQPRSDDEDDTSPNFGITPAGRHLAPMYDLMCNKPKYTTDLQWNQISNLEPSGPKDETLQLVHHGHLDNSEKHCCMILFKIN